jgi:DNA polymerase-3 subunit delta'
VANRAPAEAGALVARGRYDARVAKRVKKSSEVELPPPPKPEGPRPILLSEVVGQDRAIGVLTAALRAGRVHHAWVFHGPPGVGKFTTALAFAALLLDPTTQATFTGEIAADPDSQVQKLLRAGTHPDLFVVNKEMAVYASDEKVRKSKQISIAVDVIREFVLEPGLLGPTLRNEAAAGKVFIIDEAELMRSESQNAVLKFLEEPPERVVIILVTSSEERLLPTIRSRCQRVFFGALHDAAMERWLERQSWDMSPEERAWLLKFAEGSPGVFALAREGGLYEWWTRLAPMLRNMETGVFAVELAPTMTELVKGWAEAWVDAHENASKEAANKAGADWMFRLLANYWRARLAKAAPLGKSGPYLAAIDAVRNAEPEMDSNVNIDFVMEKLSAEMTAAFSGG